MIEQINDREATVSYPNEDAYSLMKEANNIWVKIIDPQNKLILERKHLDNFLEEAGIVKDYKEINRFLTGSLSGVVIKRSDYVKKSQYLKLIFKGVLRDCVKNIITYNKLGIDNAMMNLNKETDAAQVVPFSHQIGRYQRFILYSGIKTKNSLNDPVKDR